MSDITDPAPAGASIEPADLAAIASTKSTLTSLTFWGIQCGLIGGWLSGFGPLIVAKPEPGIVVGALAALLTAEGALLAGVGRARATGGLH